MTAAAPPVREVRGFVIVKHYPGAKALDGVDFDVKAGEVHCLLSPNGAASRSRSRNCGQAPAPARGSGWLPARSVGVCRSVRRAGKGRQAARVLLIVVFSAFGVLFVLQDKWLTAALMLVAVGGATAAFVKGRAP